MEELSGEEVAEEQGQSIAVPVVVRALDKDWQVEGVGQCEVKFSVVAEKGVAGREGEGELALILLVLESILAMGLLRREVEVDSHHSLCSAVGSNFATIEN